MSKKIGIVLGAALAVAGCNRSEAKQEPTAKAAVDHAPAAPAEKDSKPVIIDHKLESLEGEPVDLSSYRGKAMLLVNVASECGYTPQYEDLEALYQKYKDKGLVVIGLPSNDFGGQEPGSAAEIRKFCDTRFHVTFPMMAKLHAKGDEISPLYRTLTMETPEALRGEVRWNFSKFLVDTNGVPVARFDSKVKPLSDELVQAIEKVLPQG
ncbi:glutathione peroxidase [Vulgatibacter incomptus]|uniref:Glutathione peroxidase n=1 Tax=Vulgatibacter incomptus TaxID=1391653 RepID=A0A0K1PID9_9BACT|nr:glutathione peroxidase [Vulgatibacter incomptus]AKU92879.1 Glutathione peroxidase family protein [Vulgatibacter incomptus]